jgi:hypothetical protein
MKPEHTARKMRRQSVEGSRTPAAKSAAKARRDQQRAKHSSRSAR